MEQQKQESGVISQEEQVLESLIAISYTSLEEESSGVKHFINKPCGVAKENAKDFDKLRSMLISISYDAPKLSNGI